MTLSHTSPPSHHLFPSHSLTQPLLPTISSLHILSYIPSFPPSLPLIHPLLSTISSPHILSYIPSFPPSLPLTFSHTTPPFRHLFPSQVAEFGTATEKNLSPSIDVLHDLQKKGLPLKEFARCLEKIGCQRALNVFGAVSELNCTCVRTCVCMFNFGV